MSEWKMLTLVGQDKSGIVANISNALFAIGGQLGEASMMRLGGNFTIMLMVNSSASIEQLQKIIEPVAQSMKLTCHLQCIEGHLHQHAIPDTRITVYCADRIGIVAQVTTLLSEKGFNIMDLESDVAGNETDPIYVMHIEGLALNGSDELIEALQEIKEKGVHIDVTPIELLLG
jgi:glycine cleavage system transcriptional repressor